MTREKKLTALGLIACVAGLIGCGEPPTDVVHDFGTLEALGPVQLIVYNATGSDIGLSIEFGEQPNGGGTAAAGQLVSLGVVTAGQQELFALEPAMVADAPARFVVESMDRGAIIESEWMWLHDDGEVGIRVTRFEVIRVDTRGKDLPEACPAPNQDSCPTR